MLSSCCAHAHTPPRPHTCTQTLPQAHLPALCAEPGAAHSQGSPPSQSRKSSQAPGSLTTQGPWFRKLCLPPTVALSLGPKNPDLPQPSDPPGDLSPSVSHCVHPGSRMRPGLLATLHLGFRGLSVSLPTLQPAHSSLTHHVERAPVCADAGPGLCPNQHGGS